MIKDEDERMVMGEDKMQDGGNGKLGKRNDVALAPDIAIDECSCD